MSIEVCLDYALRIALLWKARHSQDDSGSAPSSSGVTNAATTRREADTPARVFDLSSLFARDSTKTLKYPEKLFKVLDASLPRIAMGQDKSYTDQRFRRIVASFWSSTWPDKTFQKQMRESRKMEDLVIHFVTIASKSLKKDESLVDGAWVSELNTQISIFMSLLIDSLESIGPTSTDLIIRIGTYRQQLLSTEASASDSASVTRSALVADRTSKPQSNGTSARLLINAVADLSHLTESQLAERESVLEPLCTEQAALDDLKQCLTMLNIDASVMYRSTDFVDPSDWTAYKDSENRSIQNVMLDIVKSQSRPLQPPDRPMSHDLAVRLGNVRIDKSHNLANSLVFVPSDPRHHYQALLNICLDRDLEELQSLPEDQEVSLGILSTEHQLLLLECSAMWRLPDTFRVWTSLAALVERLEKGLVPAECVHEAMSLLSRVTEDKPVETWPKPEREGLRDTLARRDLCLVARIERALDDSQLGFSDPLLRDAVMDCLTAGVATGPSSPSMDRLIQDITTQVQRIATELYKTESEHLLHRHGSICDEYISSMSGWIEKGLKKLQRDFGEFFAPGVDIVALVVEHFYGLWHDDFARLDLSPRTGADITVRIELYWKVRKMVEMRSVLSLRPKDTGPLLRFGAIVTTWLEESAAKTNLWVDESLAVDTFKPVTENGPSPSVTDLIESLRSIARLVLDLDWPDERQLAVFVLRLSKIFSIAIQAYCTKIDQLFAADMSETESKPGSQSNERQKAWLEKAKSTLASMQGEQRLRAFFNFSSYSCVKLNNIEATRIHLDDLYRELKVDDLSHLLAGQTTPTSPHSLFLFTIKIVLAEGLIIDGSSRAPDAFVIISNEKGARFAKTRTVYEEGDPRWDETFDVPVREPTWFMASIKHRQLSTAHDVLGRAYFRLDPRQYANMISNDVLLPLDSGGQLLLRISMEGERDDMQYHFGKAFRALGRTESDMVRTFVDKMVPVLRHTLSRASIKSILKPSIPVTMDYQEALGKLTAMYKSVNYNKAIGNVSAAYRTAVGSADYAIPPPPLDDRSSTRNADHSNPALRNSRVLKDSDIESAIHPLFDYLEANMFTLASSLSKAALQNVMTKLWKQILESIERLIVPPLGDKPSSMKPLAGVELEIVLKWLTFMRNFLHLDGDERGLPESTLNNNKYHELLRIGLYYDWATDDLMEECVRGLQITLKHKAMKPTKTLLSQRNLGTIRARQSAKRARSKPEGSGSSEMIMKILRMRSGTHEFLNQVLQTISVVKMDNAHDFRGRTSYET